MGRGGLAVHALSVRALSRHLSRSTGIHFPAAGLPSAVGVRATGQRFYTVNASQPHNAFAAASGGTVTDTHSEATLPEGASDTRLHRAGQHTASPHPSGAPSPSASSATSAGVGTPTASQGTSPATPPTGGGGSNALTTPDPEPVRWVQRAYQDLDNPPMVDAKGEYIVSRVQWPTGEVAYRTPAPVDDKLSPRFGYNVVQVRKHVSWWTYNQKHPRLSVAYINIQVLFLLGLAWLVALLTTEYRQTVDAMRTPGAMVGDYRGRGPVTSGTQKITFEKDEMSALLDRAQNNWYDGTAEASYVGSKDYRMRKIPRPKEFSAEDVRKR
ncbi:hypothetical protein LSCM1_05610 [Leishmania martiniquensis]|uniref:Uncharacterized protein n=1 Tax=Leishmania martiniquensis TaxID=1580590 RepID=A0A836HP50_9TRYP|nr:hypothetical protein LSCM1_05610 [Leishmania martiniquensis]